MQFKRIQVLRFLAAAAVVLYHAQITMQSYMSNAPYFSILSYGQYGVDLFFVISGFIIFRVGTTREVKSGTFVRNRIERIVPMYWGVTLFIFVLSNIPLIARSGAPSSADLMKSLFFLKWTSGPATYPVLNVGWTLEYEMFFYLVAAVMMVFTKKPFLFVAILLAVLATAGRGTDFFLGNPIVLEFIFGMAIGAALGDRWLSICLAAIGLIALVLLPRSDAMLRVWLFGLPSAVVVGLSVFADLRRPYQERFLPELGNSSYSIYLVHVVVISIMCKITVRVFPSASILPVILLISAVAIFVGHTVYLVAERPLMQFLKGWNGQPSAKLPTRS